MEHIGSGPTLAEACHWLKSREERHRRILDVVERDSVIEGLPPFQAETRARIADQLKRIPAPDSAAVPRE